MDHIVVHLSVANIMLIRLGKTPGPTTPKPKSIAMIQTYAADRTGLLIVDPYNDFMSKGGKLYDAIKPTAEASGMFDNLRKLIPAIRERRMQVFIVPHHRACDHDHHGWRHINMFIKKGESVRAFEVGTWGGEFNEEFGPKDCDVIVKEHWAQSGFANTDLDLQLKQHSIEKIIVVGLIANSCIESTARYGMELGYHVTLVPDATAAFNPEGMVAAATNAPMFAHAILTTRELIEQLPAA
jgi:nicotinamidase-related amidase